MAHLGVVFGLGGADLALGKRARKPAQLPLLIRQRK
jgi:hypothetical protein